MSAVSHRHLVVERVLMSVLSLSLAYLVKEPIARHAACLVLLLGFAAVLLFTNCCSVPAFARSRAVAVLVASWSLATNIGQYYGLHDDSYAVVFLSGAFIRHHRDIHRDCCCYGALRLSRSAPAPACDSGGFTL